MKRRVGDRLNSSGAMKMKFNILCVSLGVHTEFPEILVQSTVMCEAENLGMRMDERHMLDVMKMD